MTAADTRFSLLSAHDPAEAARWAAAWERWPAREVFAHPAYVRLFVDGTRHRAAAALFETADATVLYPFVLRDLAGEPWHEAADSPAADITSPYGYGGAAVWGTGRPGLAEEFWRAFDAWAAEAGVVSEFVRFSLFRDGLLDHPVTRETRQGNVVRTLDLAPEALWMDYEHKVRKNVKKAQRGGLRVERDDDAARLDEFCAVYEETMDRRGADRGYYFGRPFFERLCTELPGQYAFFHVFAGERIVSTELVLVSSENVYSFLGGTREDAFDLRPNDLLKHEVVTWAAAAGKRRFVLGGGYRPGDGIFRYKLAFAPAGETPFEIGTRVLRPALYAALEARAASLREGRDAAEGFFPRYRA